MIELATGALQRRLEHVIVVGGDDERLARREASYRQEPWQLDKELVYGRWLILRGENAAEALIERAGSLE